MDATESAKQNDQITLVAPNGAKDPIKFHPHDTVAKTLAEGVRYFGKTGALDPNQQYILVLGDTPLSETSTLGQDGVRSGNQLKIRSKQIPGDGNASETF